MDLKLTKPFAAMALIALLGGVTGYQVAGLNTATNINVACIEPEEFFIPVPEDDGDYEDEDEDYEEDDQQDEEAPVDEEDGTATTSFDSQKFNRPFVIARPVSLIRHDNYGVGHKGEIQVQFHRGGKQIAAEALDATITAVIQRMPNLKSTAEFKALLLETLATESGLGREKVSTGIKRWANYGIAQFRINTAKETLKWLRVVRPDVHAAVMAFYDGKQNLTYNLTYNVPFSIALMAQYYWRRVPDIYSNIGDRKARGQVWKVAYNSPKGLGTVNAYLRRTAEVLD